MATICVFCGANVGYDPAFAVAAVDLGVAIAEGGHDLVYGGGRVGLMGVLADAALAAGARVAGFMPQALVDREVAHLGLTELVVTDSMHTRKAAMCDRADGFIALPGGYGTLDEVLEILTWNQIGTIAKPVAFLDVDGYFDLLFRFLDDGVEAGLVMPAHRAMAQRATTVRRRDRDRVRSGACQSEQVDRPDRPLKHFAGSCRSCSGLLASLLIGTSDFLGARSAGRTTALQTTTAAFLGGGVAAMFYSPLLGNPRFEDIALGALSGVALAIALTTLWRAYALSSIGVAAPIAAVVSTVVPVLYGAARGRDAGGARMARHRGRRRGVVPDIVATRR